MNIIAFGLCGFGCGADAGDEDGGGCGIGDAGDFDGGGCGHGNGYRRYGCGDYNLPDGNGKGFRLQQQTET